ncbi:hypothetical protein [Kitasatospora sp. NPDC058218]|uniref:hypothetical protein n=1 Tax=Kitasatospora sp. NPDC058218 TaxID=3346385 RepID=UPI0036DA9A74
MSSSAGYGWSYVDREAEARRRLRAQLAAEAQRAEALRRAEERRAELRARLGELAEQAQGLRGEAKQVRRAYRTAKVHVPAVAVPAGADEAELTRAIERARESNTRAAKELAEAVSDVWTTLVPEAVAEPARTAQETRAARAAEAAGRERAQAAAQAEAAARIDRVRAGALAEAEAMLARDVPRCDPADLVRVAGLVRSLKAAGTVSEVRTTLTDLAALVQHSVRGRTREEERAVLRAGLLELAAEADPADRDRLTEELAAAEDPALLRPAVEAAVARADAHRHRVPVAAALAEVLRERNYLVGEDFVDLLAEEGAVVVPFDGAGGGPEGTAADGAAPVVGYGLRVALSADRAALSTSVVRRSGEQDRRSDGDGPWEQQGQEDQDGQDELVQRWFCDEQLPAIEEGVRRQGVRLERTSAMAPGTMAAGAVPGGSWPQPPSAATPRGAKKRRGDGSKSAAPYEQRERQRER